MLTQMALIPVGIGPEYHIFGNVPASTTVFCGAGCEFSGLVVRNITAASGLPFAGFAKNTVVNAAVTPTQDTPLQLLRGCDVYLPFPGVLASDRGKPVYMTDNNTLTMAAGPGNVQIGDLMDAQGAVAYVKLLD